MFLTALATAPQTPASTLAYLAKHCERSRPGQHAGTLRDVARAITTHPNTTTGDIGRLLRWDVTLLEDVLKRPGTDATAAISWIDMTRTGRQAPSVAALRAAITTVPDPDGTLAQYALQHRGGARVWQLILNSTTVPDDIRLQAAHLLAARESHTIKDTLDVAKVARAVPQSLTSLLECAGSDMMRDVLNDAAEQMLTGAPPRPGTSEWFTSRDVETSTVLAYLDDAPVAAWRSALDNRPDTDGTLAQGALRCFGNHPDVLARLLQPHRPAQVRQRALLEVAFWQFTLRGRDAERNIASTLHDAPAQTVNEIARLLTTDLPVSVVLARTDISEAALDRLTETYLTSEPPQRAGLQTQRSALVWGVALALHPCSSARQRAEGLTWSLSFSTPSYNAFTADRARLQLDSAHALARLGQRLVDEPAHVVGRDFPLGALQDRTLSSLPPVTDLICATLADAMGDLSDDGVLMVLTALAGDFRGTLGELLTTAKAVAA